MRRTVNLTGRSRRRPGADRGQAAVEFVGMLPILLLGGVAVVQFGIAMWTVSSTDEATRQAARAYSLDGAGAARPAAEGSLPGALEVKEISTAGTGHTVQLTVEIPRVFPILPKFGDVTREVVMP